MLTISELAKRYDLAESTARYYCKRFRQFLPHVGTGKRRRYLETGVPVFEDILAAMQKNKNANAVEVYLQSKYTQAGAGPAAMAKAGPVAGPTAATSLTAGGLQQELLEQQTKALARIADALECLVGRDKAPGVADNAAVLTDQGRELASLREEVKELRTLQLDAERLHQNDLEQLRKWLGRLGRERKEN